MHPLTEDLTALARQAESRSILGAGDSPPLLVAVAAPLEAGASPLRALDTALDGMREASSRDRVRALGLDQGYRIEDAQGVALGLPPQLEASELLEWLRRRLPEAVSVELVRREGPLTLAIGLAARVGAAPARGPYARGPDGRIRIESFELHVVEHCNLRCANCCNISPHVPSRMLSVEEVEALCGRMAKVLSAEVLKIMGGEPLLHPEIATLLRVFRASGLGDRVRLFTNGLLLPTMQEAFWEALDHLTISNYVSAPVKPAILEQVRERSRRHGFVLNIKPVSEFSQVVSPRLEPSVEKTRETYARCWLRHRCINVRDGRFYKCTRASYAVEFGNSVAQGAQEPSTGRHSDGVRLDAPDLAAEIEAYLNREDPLDACRRCFGGDGAVEPHYQLTRDEVARGMLSRPLGARES
jgi:organic radical activating enzyme